MKVECVGQFACRGTEPRHASVNWLADNWYKRQFVGNIGDIQEAADIIAQYAADPNHPDFASLSKEQREILAAAVADTLPDTHIRTEALPPMPMPPREKRPSARDLLKAEIFLEEILEEKSSVRGPFLCIG